MQRGKVLTTKLFSQGYKKETTKKKNKKKKKKKKNKKKKKKTNKLVATLKKFYGRHHDLVNPYNVAVFRIVSDVCANDEP